MSSASDHPFFQGVFNLFDHPAGTTSDTATLYNRAYLNAPTHQGRELVK